RVVVATDVTLAALGAGAAPGCRGDLAYLSVGTGLAAGFVLDGRIRRGAHGAAGEIGHLPVDPEGPVCECGQRGCLEVLASGAAIAARWPSDDGEITAAASLLAAAEAGDPAARALLNEVAGHLAGAVALLAQTVDPEAVGLGGGVAQAGARPRRERACRTRSAPPCAAGPPGPRCWRRSISPAGSRWSRRASPRARSVPRYWPATCSRSSTRRDRGALSRRHGRHRPHAGRA